MTEQQVIRMQISAFDTETDEHGYLREKNRVELLNVAMPRYEAHKLLQMLEIQLKQPEPIFNPMAGMGKAKL